MASRSIPASAPLVLVFASWAVAVAMVGVGGDFPLSDDWAYAHVVRSLLAGNGFDFLPWTGASVVAQALVGAAVCKAAGFSYVTLRVTMLAWSALGVAAFHDLLRTLGAGAGAAAAGAAMLAFSPLWFNLSFTFMTDVAFAATAIAAAALHARALARPSGRGLHLAAGAVAAVAFLIRQHAVWISAAAAVACLVPLSLPARAGSDRADIDRWRPRLLDAAAASALPLVVVAIHTAWTFFSAQAPLAAHNKIGEALASSFVSIAVAAFRGLATLGFLFLPWAVSVRSDGRSERRLFAAVLAVLALAALLLFEHEGAAMFYLSNVMADSSVGALTTRDTQFLALSRLPAAGPVLRALLTAASLASAALLVARLVCALPRVGRVAAPRAALFCVVALALSALGSLAQAHYYFDRYLIAILPLAVASVAALSGPPRLGVATGAVMAALAFYSVAGTHDYLAWNRARWELLARLERSGVSARRIDGGFEYNAERLAAELGTSPSDTDARRGQASSNKSWWWVVDDTWVIAFGPLEGYLAGDEIAYARWLPPGEGRIFALRRSAGPSVDDAASGAATD